jgi:hypothetical protein
MNAREGMRRLAIVLGIAGSLTGSVFGYQNARDVWNARSAHKRFESLAATPAIQKDVKELVDTIQKGQSKNLSTLSDEQLQVYKNLLESTPPGERQKLARLDRRASGDGIDQFTIDPSTSTITSIQLSTGELLSRTPPPTLAAWIALPLYPLVGFLIPWGAIRALTWVGSGFFQSSQAGPQPLIELTNG